MLLKGAIISTMKQDYLDYHHTLALRLRTRRLANDLTQQGLALRSGVPLGTLKKFERTGQISLASFIRLLFALRDEAALDGILCAPEFQTLEDVLEKPTRQRGRIT